MTDLKATAGLMRSGDYKERFAAELLQLDTRGQKLATMIDKWDKGELDFTPTCPREMYDAQLKAMKDYCNVLLERADLEKVDFKAYREPSDVQKIKWLRTEIQSMIGDIRGFENSRETAIACTKLQEAAMWLGQELGRRQEAYPYPNGANNSSHAIDPKAQELQNGK